MSSEECENCDNSIVEVKDAKTKPKLRITPIKIFWIILGFICFGLGTVGVFLPILPTVPFYLVTLFAFTKSSQRLHDWFVKTKLYKKHLESYVNKRAMTLKTKIMLCSYVTLIMGLGFFFMARKGLWIPCGILGAVWVFHALYFAFRVKTEKIELSEEQVLAKIEKKRQKEQLVVKQMIHLYCRKKHKIDNGHGSHYDKKSKTLCDECAELTEYAVTRSEHCPHMAEKTFCSNCKTHCYSPVMRDRIKTVMRFSGPRILFYHPILASWHLICSIQQKRRKNDKDKID